MKGIVPGEYSLLAWEAIESGAYLSPDFLGRFENLSLQITVGLGSSQTVSLKVIPH